MKHRQVGIGKVGVINPDGHAIGLDIGATACGQRSSRPARWKAGRRSPCTASARCRCRTAQSSTAWSTTRSLTAALKHLWQKHKFECRNVILGIANQQVLVRDLQMPNLDPQQRAKALPFQAREIVALPIDEVVLDFAPLGEADPETNLVNGLLLATPRQPVLAAVQAVEEPALTSRASTCPRSPRCARSPTSGSRSRRSSTSAPT